MEIVFFDKNKNIIELNDFFYKYPKDNWKNDFFVKTRWYRDDIIFKLKIDEEDFIIAVKCKINNIDINNIIIEEDESFLQDDFKSMFDTKMKVSKDNTYKYYFCNQEKIKIPIQEYLKTLSIFNGSPIKIDMQEYDNDIVKQYIKMMKDLNIKEYSYIGSLGIKYDIINHDTHFTVSETSEWHRLNFELW